MPTLRALILTLAALPAMAQSTCDAQLIVLYKQKAAQLSDALTLIAALNKAVATQTGQISNLESRLAPFIGAVGAIRLDPIQPVAQAPEGTEVLPDGTWKPAPYTGKLFF